MHAKVVEFLDLTYNSLGKKLKDLQVRHHSVHPGKPYSQAIGISFSMPCKDFRDGVVDLMIEIPPSLLKRDNSREVFLIGLCDALSHGLAIAQENFLVAREYRGVCDKPTGDCEADS